MVQIENEYGFYNACDKSYLNALCDLTQKILGNETCLFTNDGAYQNNLECGNIIPRAYATVDFGQGDPLWRFELERKFNGGTGPYFVTEYHTGHMDHWEEAHHKVDAHTVASEIDIMLANNGNVNLYMYYGGTSFGFFNGANGDSSYYQAHTTSYDHDAPLTEAGDLSYKYYLIRDVVRKYFPNIPSYDVQNTTKKSYGDVKFTQGISLYDALDVIGKAKLTDDKLRTFEYLGVDYGFVLYQTKLNIGGTITIPKVHDRAHIFVNRKYFGTMVHCKEKSAKIDVPAGNLDIFVENQGRNCYGNTFVEYKGLPGGVKLDGKDVTGWTMTGFNLSNIQDVKFTNNLPTKVPSFYRATFNVDVPEDTFLNPKDFKKGVAFVNGFNLGRYWTVGPQITLYCPKPVLKAGENELIIFEIDSQSDTVGTMSFDDVAQIDSI